MDLKELTLKITDSLKDAMERLDLTGTGLLFVVDHENKLRGVLTDGDIRRALLKQSTLQSTVDSVMNKNFVSYHVNTDNEILLEKIGSKLKMIPLVDDSGQLVDYASFNKIRTIPVAAPSLDGNELAYVTECIKTNWISSQGKYVRQFEELFKNYHENYSALAVSNGTVALHLALKALDIDVGDEVLVPNLTFAASINAIIYTGATPILVEVDPDTWNIDLSHAEAQVTKRTKAIMPVHLYGYPCNMDSVLALAAKFNLKIIEDCAEALGSFYHRRPVGVFGDAATFSFYGNKMITTGEGGMVLFRDPNIAARAAVLRDHGMDKSRRYWHLEVGFNYRLTNIQAAIGVAQFERLEEFVAAKRKIARSYNEVLGKSPYFKFVEEQEGIVNSYWLYTFVISSGAPFTREDLTSFLTTSGIETRPVFFPLHQMPPYRTYLSESTFPVSERISKFGISLPSSVTLTELEISHICTALKSFIKRHV